MCFYNFNHQFHTARKPRKSFKIMQMVGHDADGNVLINSELYPRETPYRIGDTIKASVCESWWTPAERISFVNGKEVLNGEVVHSFMKDDDILYRGMKIGSRNLVLVECEIPSEEIYWEDEIGYASFSLVIKKVYDFKWKVTFETPFKQKYEEYFSPTLDLEEVKRNIAFLRAVHHYSWYSVEGLYHYSWYTIEKVPFGVYDASAFAQQETLTLIEEDLVKITGVSADALK